MKDRELTRLRRKHIGFVFQSFNLLPTLTAEENILLPLAIAGKQAAGRRGRSAARPRRPRRAPRPHARPAVGRPAAARRDRPRPDHAADRAVRRRADRQPRLRGRRRHPPAAARRRRRRRPDDPHGHARPARGGDRRPRRCTWPTAASSPTSHGPTEDDVLAVMKERRPMTRVVIKGLAAPAAAHAADARSPSCVGVAFVCAALHASPTRMRGASDSLSSAAYDGTDAVVDGQDRVRGSHATDWARAAHRRRRHARQGPARRRASSSPSATSPTPPRSSGATASRSATGPYFGVGFDARTPGAERLTPFRLADGRWAAGPGEVVIDPATAEKEELRGRRPREGRDARRGARVQVVGIATFADVKSLGTATFAVFDLAEAQTLFDKAGRYDRILVAGLAGSSAPAGHADALGGRRRPLRSRRPGARSSASCARSCSPSPAWRCSSGAFTIFNTLSITVAQRTRELGLLRMVGAGRRQVRARRCCSRRWRSACWRRCSASAPACCSRPGSSACSSRWAWGCRRVDVAERRHGGRRAAGRRRRDGGGGADAGAAGDQGRPGRRPARGLRRGRAGAPARPRPARRRRRSSAAPRRGSAARPAGSPAATRCATPAAPRPRRRRC